MNTGRWCSFLVSEITFGFLVGHARPNGSTR